MIKRLNKIILPIVLITALVAFEIGCQYLCKTLMPDETDKVYTHSKSNDTQLMVINDEDNSRFYPRMAAINSETMTVDDYLRKLYAQSIGESESQLHSEVYDENITEMMNTYRTELESRLELAVFVFSGIDCKDLLSFAKIEQDTGLLYIQDHPVDVSEDKTKELSIIIRLSDARVLYYRLSDPDSRVATPAEVTQTSKKLISDINSFLPYWNDLYFPYYSRDSEIYDNDEYTEERNYSDDAEFDGDDYTEDQRNILTEQAKMLDTDHPDNKIAAWLNKLLMNLSDEKHSLNISSFEEKNDEMPYINIVTAIYQNESGISVVFPFRLSGNDGKPSEQEYHIYSIGDELMIVFETGAKYQTILYYDVGEGCFTGFSA